MGASSRVAALLLLLVGLTTCVCAHARGVSSLQPLLSAAVRLAPTEQITAAFAKDGYTVVKSALLNSRRGFLAQSESVTLYTTGEAKRVLYVEGDGYEMGYLTGYLAWNETNEMGTTYLDHIVPSLVDETLDDLLSHDIARDVYDYIVHVFRDLMVHDAYDSFMTQIDAGIFEAAVVDEMHGLVDGLHAAMPSSTVTFADLVTLNYGIDYLFAQIYSGHIIDILIGRAARHFTDERVARVRAALAALDPTAFRVPVYCDAFAVRGKFLKDPSGSLFARDYQMQNGLVYQDVNTMTIFRPTDGRRALIAAHGPGMVGAITAMNEDGLAIGVDVLRSVFVNHTVPGLNSLMMVRGAAHHAGNSVDAVEYMRQQHRGITWFYPMSDASGHGIIVEAGRSQPDDGTVPDMLSLETDAARLRALPNASFFAAHSKPDYSRGIFARHIDYEFPEEFLQYNEALFELAGVPFNSSAEAWGPNGFVYKSFDYENSLWKKIWSCYFSPQRENDPDVVLVSNFAVTPQMRVSQMPFWAKVVPGEAMQWRYDELWSVLQSVRGTMDLEVAKWAVLFLSPDRTPGFWTHEAVPGDWRSTLVEGSIHAMDLRARVMATKAGYFGDGWLQLSLLGYV